MSQSVPARNSQDWRRTWTRRSFGPALLAVALAAATSAAAATSFNRWAPTGAMHDPRGLQTATSLGNGEVLVTGGTDQNGLQWATAELYHPATGTWTRTGSMAFDRAGHTATRLPSGLVLVAGGCGGDMCSTVHSSAELYHPATGKWTGTGHMTTGRFSDTATLLTSGPLAGQVLVVGGCCTSTGAPLASAELYNPHTGRWTSTGSLATGRQNHAATLLPSGKVVVTGGMGNHGKPLASAQVYDPATQRWTATGNMTTARYAQTATLLPNGEVLVAGGAVTASAEVYNPATARFTATAAMTAIRIGSTATLLRNGMVLVAGGSDLAGTPLPSAELYDPATRTWTATANMAHAREGFTATLLGDGRVLAAGGCCSLASAEVFTPRP